MEKRLSLSNVIIEITRRCNLQCHHCLRGDAQNIDISLQHIDHLFAQVESIGILTISGGEPSLQPGIIRYIVDSARSHGTSINNFYIATNGKRITDAFIHSLLDLYLYCDENHISMVQISNDEFHDIDIDDEGIEKLMCLKFASFKHVHHYHLLDYKYLIKEGRAKNFGEKIEKPFDFNESIHDKNLNDCGFYLNAKGFVLTNCNWSYETQDQMENIFCPITSLYDMVSHTINKEKEVV